MMGLPAPPPLTTHRCVNAGHCPERIVKAVQEQVATLDFAPTFNMGHPLAFEYAHRLTTELYPGKVSLSVLSRAGK
jgi:adenosylmethionine-8-amino-7-oxononanoate aminotransferase